MKTFANTLGQLKTVKSNFIQRLEATPVQERRELLITHIRSQIAKVLNFKVPRQIGLRQSLFELGIDSLMAVELSNLLQSRLGISIRSTVLLDYHT